MPFEKGDFAKLNGAICVVVGIKGDAGVPDEHVAASFGEVNENGSPIAHTVPIEYFEVLLTQPDFQH